MISSIEVASTEIISIEVSLLDCSKAMARPVMWKDDDIFYLKILLCKDLAKVHSGRCETLTKASTSASLGRIGPSELDRPSWTVRTGRNRDIDGLFAKAIELKEITLINCYTYGRLRKSFI